MLFESKLFWVSCFMARLFIIYTHTQFEFSLWKNNIYIGFIHAYIYIIFFFATSCERLSNKHNILASFSECELVLDRTVLN